MRWPFLFCAVEKQAERLLSECRVIAYGNLRDSPTLLRFHRPIAISYRGI
jgi:hypothetical protein